uniref:PRT6_C domain-containing protein n=1 Tax=Macrostomum lignano TaxID=282301 RepID=A0A1I8FPY0_9PLAT
SATLHVTLARFLLTHTPQAFGKDAPQFLAPLYTVCIDRFIKLLLARWPSTFADMFADKILPACPVARLQPGDAASASSICPCLSCSASSGSRQRQQQQTTGGPACFVAACSCQSPAYWTNSPILILLLLTADEVYSSAANDDVGGGGDCGDCLRPDAARSGRAQPCWCSADIDSTPTGPWPDGCRLLARRLIDRRPRALLDQLDECLDFARGPMEASNWPGALPINDDAADNDELDGADSGEVAGESEAQRIARLYECLELLAYRDSGCENSAGRLCRPPTLVLSGHQPGQGGLLCTDSTYAESCPPSPDCGYAEIQCLLTRLGELLPLLASANCWSRTFCSPTAFGPHENPQSVARVTQLVTRLGLETPCCPAICFIIWLGMDKGKPIERASVFPVFAAAGWLRLRPSTKW